MVNASRTVIDSARRAYANVMVIAITAPQEVLAERLKMRSRGSDEEIRGAAEPQRSTTSAPDVTILNVGRPEDHARRLVRAIKGS